jgi:hypothetical protein
MTFGLLSKMENIRYRKENILETIGFNTTMIVTGSVIFVSGIILVGFMGLAALPQDQNAVSGSSNIDMNPICFSTSGCFLLLALILFLLGIIRRVSLNRDITAAENEYQKIQSQLMANLEMRYSLGNESKKANP